MTTRGRSESGESRRVKGGCGKRTRMLRSVPACLLVGLPVMGVTAYVAAWHRANRARVVLEAGEPVLALSVVRDQVCVAEASGYQIIDQAGSVLERAKTDAGVVIEAIAPNVLAIAGGDPLDTSRNPESFGIRITENGVTRRELVGHAWLVHALAVSPDGRTLVSGGRDRTIRVWDIDTGSARAVMPVRAELIRSLAVSRDGDYLVAAACETVVVVNLRTEQHIRTIQLEGPSEAASVAFGSGDEFFVGTTNGELVSFNARSDRGGRTVASLTSGVWGLDCDETGDLLCAGTRRGDVVLMSTSSGDILRLERNAHDGECRAVRFSIDGNAVYSAGLDGVLRRWPVYPWWRW